MAQKGKRSSVPAWTLSLLLNVLLNVEKRWKELLAEINSPSVSDMLACYSIVGFDVVVGFVAKLSIWGYVLVRMAFSREMTTFEQSRAAKWRLPRPEDVQKDPVFDAILQGEVRRYKIVYVRHAESVWNSIFNAGGGLNLILLGEVPGSKLVNVVVFIIKLIVRVAATFIDELLLITEVDSNIIDSPISVNGVRQCKELASWSQLGSSIPERCVYISSNLRRAISTLLIGFNHQIKPSNPVRIVSCLQEVTRNPDSVTYSFGGVSIPAQMFNKQVASRTMTERVEDPVGDIDLGHAVTVKVDWKTNIGNRGVLDKLEHRFEALLTILDDIHDNESMTTFVIAGHSLFLRKLLQFYLPPAAAKHTIPASRKINNCGVLAFDVVSSQTHSGRHHAIDAKTLELIRGNYL